VSKFVAHLKAHPVGSALIMLGVAMMLLAVVAHAFLSGW
jgi:hypothetical protein